ncbi:tRNA preQ1(34) S-adenosylmethionine ribosyltransferase-isomerase QueA [soil metagenome]
MRVDLLSYDLPSERIAQYPTGQREEARMLSVPREGEMSHHRVGELAEHLPEGALVVLNDTRVLPARLIAVKETGGRVEIFLVRRTGETTVEARGEARAASRWRALGKASKALRFGVDLRVIPADETASAKGALVVRLLCRADDDGLLDVALYTVGDLSVDDAIQAFGRMPLPPYIKRDAEKDDVERYQTVFARAPGAIAAPTAGLHLSRAVLGRLAVRGCEVVTVTLHVGLGTFQPVTVEDLDQHAMHTEHFEVSRVTSSAIAKAKSEGRTVVAVGTTVIRALESAVENGEVKPMMGDTKLLIQPGHTFHSADILLTNFHLPRSTLLALVCAFGGKERVFAAYKTAIDAGYRFYSYGDAMLLERSP